MKATSPKHLMSNQQEGIQVQPSHAPLGHSERYPCFRKPWQAYLRVLEVVLARRPCYVPESLSPISLLLISLPRWWSHEQFLNKPLATWSLPWNLLLGNVIGEACENTEGIQFSPCPLSSMHYEHRHFTWGHHKMKMVWVSFSSGHHPPLICHRHTDCFRAFDWETCSGCVFWIHSDKQGGYTEVTSPWKIYKTIYNH